MMLIDNAKADLDDKKEPTGFPFGYLLFGLIAFLISTHVAVAGPHPNMYLNQAEIDAIKEKVANNIEPWASAHDKVISDANLALLQNPLSVTFQGSTSNEYFTVNPRCGWTAVDGQTPDCRLGAPNPAQDRGDYIAAIALGKSVRDLGLGYVFTGNNAYADKAIELIRVWTVDPATKMRITSTALHVELSITMPGMFYGADLIWNYEHWDSSDKTAFRAWVKEMADRTREKQIGAINSSNGTSTNLNNFANWRNVVIASAGALLDDQDLLGYMEGAWKYLISVQMNGPGSVRPGLLGEEVDRSEGLHYSLYAINAMIQGAEIMRHHGVNLYDYKDAVKNTSLKLTLDFHTPFASDPESWKEHPFNYSQSVTITQNNSMALFELAYSHYEEGYENPYRFSDKIPNGSPHADTENPPGYLKVLNRWGRPMDEIRILGNITLTHANRFDLIFTPTPPSIISQPASVSVTESEDATFSVTATGSDPLSYQWYRDGNAITGATNSSYTVTAANASDNNIVVTCEVKNNLDSISCDSAVLTVLSDTVAPTLVSAFAASDTRIDVIFSEPVTASSAENSAHYHIDLGIDVASASLSDEGRTVSLTVNPLTEDTAYTLQVSNVQDLAQNPNTIAAQSSESFTYRTADGFEDGNADGWSPRNASNWQVAADDGDQAYYLKSNPGSPGGNRLGEYSLLPGSYDDFTFTAQARLGGAGISNAAADYAVVFGFQDDNNYYYALFNNNTNYTGLFKVSDGSRTELTTPGSVETDWLTDDLYHTIRVSHTDSNITVHFDGNLIMSATDSTLGVGKVGVGSLNDVAYFDDISIQAGASGGPTNNAPTATSASITTNEDTPSEGVTAQVTDPDTGDTHSLSIMSQPSNGSAQVANNQLVYTPDSGFSGSDSFQFRATDSGDLFVDGTANVTVVENTGGGGNSAPTAASASITTDEDTQSAGVTAAVTDPDVGDTHSISLISQPSDGTATVVDNKLVYEPGTGFSGADSFVFRATDEGGLFVNGTASVTVVESLSDNAGGGSTGGNTSGGGGALSGWLLVLMLGFRVVSVFIKPAISLKK